MFDIELGNWLKFSFEIFVLISMYLLLDKKVITFIFRSKKDEGNKIKAKKHLRLLVFITFIYIISELINESLDFIHILMVGIIAIILKSIIHPLILKKYGKSTISSEKIVDLDFISELRKSEEINELSEINSFKDSFIYDNKQFYCQNDNIYEVIKLNKTTAKSNFWETAYILLIFVSASIMIVSFLHVDFSAPGLIITVIAFILAYIMSPFYVDLYSTYILSQADGMDFDDFIEIEVSGKRVFGSVEKLTFFKVSIKDYYNENIVTFFHKLFFSAIVTSFPDGRYILYRFVTSIEHRSLLKEKLPEWLKEYNDLNKSCLNSIKINSFVDNYGFGLLLRVKVIKDELNKYGQIKDEIEDLISTKTEELDNNGKLIIDLRTFDEVNNHLVKGV